MTWVIFENVVRIELKKSLGHRYIIFKNFVFLYFYWDVNTRFCFQNVICYFSSQNYVFLHKCILAKLCILSKY